MLNSKSDCHWFCPECEEQALTDVKFGMDIEAKCRQYFQIIEDRVRLVENQLQNTDHIIEEKVKHEVHGQLNSDMKTILEDEITTSRADIKNTVIADLSRVVSDKVDNLKDNEERKLNIIVFGAEESASNLKNKRNEDDTKVFIETCQNEVRTNISMLWTIGVGLRMSTLDSNVAGSIPASICFLLEQETLSALLQSTQL